MHGISLRESAKTVLLPLSQLFVLSSLTRSQRLRSLLPNLRLTHKANCWRLSTISFPRRRNASKDIPAVPNLTVPLNPNTPNSNELSTPQNRTLILSQHRPASGPSQGSLSRTSQAPEGGHSQAGRAPKLLHDFLTLLEIISLKEIQDRISSFTIHELPHHMPYAVDESLARRFLCKWGGICRKSFDVIEEHIMTAIIKLTIKYFGRFEELPSLVR